MGRTRGDPRAWLAWALAGGALAAGSRNPLVLGLLLLVVAAVGLRLAPPSTIARSWRRAGWLIIWLAAVSALVNLLTVRAGDIALATLPSDWPLIGGPLTLNALVYGLITALAALALLAIWAVFNAVVSQGDLLRLTPRPLYLAGAIASVALTFLPGMALAARQIGEAQAVRGHRPRGPRDLVPLAAPLLSLGLERGLTLAEAMEARGFGYIGERAPSRASGGGRRLLGSNSMANGSSRPGWRSAAPGCCCSSPHPGRRWARPGLASARRPSRSACAWSVPAAAATIGGDGPGATRPSRSRRRRRSRCSSPPGRATAASASSSTHPCSRRRSPFGASAPRCCCWRRRCAPRRVGDDPLDRRHLPLPGGGGRRAVRPRLAGRARRLRADRRALRQRQEHAAPLPQRPRAALLRRALRRPGRGRRARCGRHRPGRHERRRRLRLPGPGGAGRPADGRGGTGLRAGEPGPAAAARCDGASKRRSTCSASPICATGRSAHSAAASGSAWRWRR